MWIFCDEAKVSTTLGRKRSSVVIAFSNPQKVIGYQNWMHPHSFLFSFFFPLETFLLMILSQQKKNFSQHGFSIGNLFQDLRRRCEGSWELFVQIYRFSFAGLLQNILTESTSDVPYTNTDAETSKTKRTKFSDRFSKSGRSVACVMKMFHVVVSLNHLSRREVGHHLSPTSLIYFWQ